LYQELWEEGQETVKSAAAFRVKGGPGTYTITITGAALAGDTFDPLKSTILSKRITKQDHGLRLALERLRGHAPLRANHT
jgi:hypothetical protein